jgi:hypothetical protein
VEVYGNTLTGDVDKCGIVLVDQGHPKKSGGRYKTRNNKIHDTVTMFEGAACADAASDVKPSDENAFIIEDGNNLFDHPVARGDFGLPPRCSRDFATARIRSERKIPQIPARRTQAGLRAAIGDAKCETGNWPW